MTVPRHPDSSPDPSSRHPVYLDHNATAPVEPRVAAEVLHYMLVEYGNAGSRTHQLGQDAKVRVNRARAEVAAVVMAEPDEVIFTSGATESDNLALLGLASHGLETGRRHIISTQIEHKAVLEPLEVLRSRGFEVELLRPTTGGWVEAEDLARALRPDTLLVSVMAVNNETGVSQPIREIAHRLAGHDAYFHVDAAQAFGKYDAQLRDQRIDLLAVSGHKIGAPKGIGALIARRRGFRRPPLTPLMFGGGQERGLRPGTLPVPLIAGLGMASSLAVQDAAAREASALAVRDRVLAPLVAIGAQVNGDLDRTVATTLNISIPGVDSEAAILALKDLAAVSNGSACTSQSYEPSHVLKAAGLSPERIAGAIRISWGPETADVPADEMARRLDAIRVRR